MNIEWDSIFRTAYTPYVYKENELRYVRPFLIHPPMNREAIVKAASKMETTHDLLVLLNKIKMDERGDKGHPFTMPQLNYFINPKRNKKHYRTFTIPKKTDSANSAITSRQNTAVAKSLGTRAGLLGVGRPPITTTPPR